MTGEGKTDYCRKNIIEAYGITKVNKIVVGGKERYESVYKALREIEPEGYVFIHDGARPFVDESIIPGSKRIPGMCGRNAIERYGKDCR